MVSDRVKVAYRNMRKIENDLGGDGGGVGLYGSLSEGGMQVVLDCLKTETGLGSSSVFVDVGTGLGRPLVHAVIDAHVKKAVGYEIAKEKWWNARVMMQRLHDPRYRTACLTDQEYANIELIHADIAHVDALPTGTTHVYAFWQGFDAKDKMAFGRLFRKCETAQAVCVVNNVTAGWHQPVEYMRDSKFGSLRLVDKKPVKMGKNSFTAYVFVKDS